MVYNPEIEAKDRNCKNCFCAIKHQDGAKPALYYCRAKSPLILAFVQPNGETVISTRWPQIDPDQESFWCVHDWRPADWKPSMHEQSPSEATVKPVAKKVIVKKPPTCLPFQGMKANANSKA